MTCAPMLCVRTLLLTAVFTLLLTSNLAHAAEPYEITFERDVVAKMRDGVLLKADIYRPKADGQFPTLLQRTPYDKRGASNFAVKAAAHGFVVIVQDVRGRYTSEGEWYTFKHESNDGYDTIEWAASSALLQWESGHVGRVVCRSHPDAGGHCAPAAPGWHLPGRHREQLSRWVDLPGRRIRAMVRSIMDIRAS